MGAAPVARDGLGSSGGEGPPDPVARAGGWARSRSIGRRRFEFAWGVGEELRAARTPDAPRGPTSRMSKLAFFIFLFYFYY